jgi:SNF2 family DNA or RNA helicase
MQTLVAGINLHYNCSFGILFIAACNIPLEMQAGRRFDRIGQKKKVTWVKILVRNLFFIMIKRKNCEKFVEMLKNEAIFSLWIVAPGLRKLIAYELLRV